MLLLFGCKAKSSEDSKDNRENSDNNVATDSYPVENYSKPDSSANASPSMAKIQSYQYTWSENDNLPPMVIVIDDFGQTGGELLQDFAKLPSQIAFAILPDLPQTRTTAQLADKTGHEVLIHIPMQAENSSISPGKRYLKSGMESSNISELLGEFYLQMPNAIAANNHMGSATTADYNTMFAVLSELREMGLFFLDSATTAKSAVPSAAKKLGINTAKRDIFLDVPDVSDATLISKIQSLGKFKGRNEPIVVITHCHNRNKLVALQKFIAQITDMGIELIPPSKLMKQATG
jgi:polysaccharide deacetylase 2 family uncharacterized protein YibQ